jgi:hypothetical protein
MTSVTAPELIPELVPETITVDRPSEYENKPSSRGINTSRPSVATHQAEVSPTRPTFLAAALCIPFFSGYFITLLPENSDLRLTTAQARVHGGFKFFR